jgi:hypothetical protein
MESHPRRLQSLTHTATGTSNFHIAQRRAVANCTRVCWKLNVPVLTVLPVDKLIWYLLGICGTGNHDTTQVRYITVTDLHCSALLSSLQHCSVPCSALLSSLQCTAQFPAVHCSVPCSALLSSLQCSAQFPAVHCSVKP